MGGHGDCPPQKPSQLTEKLLKPSFDPTELAAYALLESRLEVVLPHQLVDAHAAAEVAQELASLLVRG